MLDWIRKNKDIPTGPRKRACFLFSVGDGSPVPKPTIYECAETDAKMLHVIAGTRNPSPTNGIEDGVEQTGVSGDDRLRAESVGLVVGEGQ